MDKTAIYLSDCRKLLRLIECEAVTDTSDQNLHDILIRSEEKKTALLTWLIQNLFSADLCSRSSFEDLLSIFMSPTELTSFLKGTSPPADQFKLWQLIMNTVYQKKTEKDLNPQNATYHLFSGKLLDELIDSWNHKVEKPAMSLVSGKKRTSDLQNEVNATREQLKQLNSLSESTLESVSGFADEESKMNDVQKYLDRDQALNQRLNQRIKLSSSPSESSARENFIHDLQRNPLLGNIKRNLLQLHNIMDSNLSKNFS